MVVRFGWRFQPNNFVNRPAAGTDKTRDRGVRHMRSRDHLSFRAFALRKRFTRRRLLERQGGFVGLRDRAIGKGFAPSAVRLAQAGFGHAAG
jgi:hypothetical protein